MVNRPSSSGLMTALFGLAVFLMPFNSIKGFEIFGELQMEAAFYVLAPMMLLFGMHRLSTRTNIRCLDRSAGYFILFVTLALFISFAFNISGMLESELRGRSGINKFMTSLLVLYFGIGLMWVTAYLARITPNFTYRYVIRPTLWVLPIVILVGLIELGSWWSQDFFKLYDVIAQWVRAGTWPAYYEGRLRSITFEPPFLGMYMSAALLMIYPTIQLQQRRIGSSLGNLWIFLLGCVILFLTGARTAFVIIAAMIGFYMLYRPFLSGRQSNTITITALFFGIIAILFYVMQNHNQMVAWVVEGESISNLSRYASNTAAMIIFTEHPLTGVGLGQYAFYAVDTMPSWGWFSYEIQEWFTDPEAAWPPIFSAPARLAAEGGIIMLLAWYGSLGMLFMKMMHKVAREYRRLGHMPMIGQILLLSLVFVFTIGIAFDSFRNFWVWISLGLCSAYLMTENAEDHFGIRYG